MRQNLIATINALEAVMAVASRAYDELEEQGYDYRDNQIMRDIQEANHRGREAAHYARESLIVALPATA